MMQHGLAVLKNLKQIIHKVIFSDRELKLQKLLDTIKISNGGVSTI